VQIRPIVILPDGALCALMAQGQLTESVAGFSTIGQIWMSGFRRIRL
jgi:hypothetical protein